MLSTTVEIRNPHGIHARPAGLFVRVAMAQPGAVWLRKAERVASGKSVLGLLTLGAKCGDRVTLEIESDNHELLAALSEILSHRPESNSIAPQQVTSGGHD